LATINLQLYLESALVAGLLVLLATAYGVCVPYAVDRMLARLGEARLAPTTPPIRPRP
jgi:hypothetical protein